MRARLSAHSGRGCGRAGVRGDAAFRSPYHALQILLRAGGHLGALTPGGGALRLAKDLSEWWGQLKYFNYLIYHKLSLSS